MSSRAPDERADALRPADLVGRERQQIGAERIDIAGDAPGRLHRIDMQQPAGGVHDRGGLRDRLHHAGLVVGEHDRDQRPRCFGQSIAPSAARSTRPSASTAMSATASRGNRPPVRTEECSIAEIRSFSRGRRSSAVWIAGVSASMLASVPLEVKKTSPGARRDQRRHLLARLFDEPPRRPPLGMHRGRIAGNRKRLAQRLGGLRPQRRRGVPIEIAALDHAG